MQPASVRARSTNSDFKALVHSASALGMGLGIEPLCGAFLTARLGTPGACAAEEGLEDLFQRSHSTNLLGGTSNIHGCSRTGWGCSHRASPAQPCQAALL